MRITPEFDQKMGATVTEFHLATVSGNEIAELRSAVYEHRILVLKDQDLTPAQYVELGRALGTIEVYYEPMYHHPEYKEIFVSGKKPGDEPKVGVPQTGKFWHADYSFMPKPFGITMTYPQIVPEQDRGTYYIDMAKVFAELSDDVRRTLRATKAEHSPRRYFKIRPSDVYRPIWEIQAEIEKTTPAVIHPTVFEHPATGEEVLYVSEAATCELMDEQGQRLPDLLHDVLAASGQLDDSFTDRHIHLQRFVKGDLLIWDNRTLVHRALHPAKPEPAMSYRVTVHDEFPFYPGVRA